MLITIGNQLTAVSKMLDSLLVWSSQQMANEKLDIQEIFPYQIIKDCENLFMDRINLKKLYINIKISPNLSIHSDLKRFEFIIRNIFNNAIKFSFKGMQQQHSLDGTLEEKGNGIGLMLCHEFANRIKCSITIESRIGFGSTFTIHIPR